MLRPRVPSGEDVRAARRHPGPDRAGRPRRAAVVLGGCLVLGFGLLLVGAGASFADGLLQALTALFTVGAVHSGGPADTGVDISVGAIWVVIVALQIAYLPALYSSFNRRESLVALLESRAGVPAWGPELLARHQLVGINDTLPDLYAAWEAWAADVAESHTTYPVLLLFRSPEPWYSWLLGLIAVLDAAAMHLALAPSQASSQARLCLRMGFTLLNRIATTLRWEVDLDPNPEGPIDLTFAEFERAVAMLVSVGFATERSAEEAWADFRGWRVNYETVAYRLADRLTVPPAPWSGQRRHMRSGPVEPRRPPQRRPGGGEPFVYDRRGALAHRAPAPPHPPRSSWDLTWPECDRYQPLALDTGLTTTSETARALPAGSRAFVEVVSAREPVLCDTESWPSHGVGLPLRGPRIATSSEELPRTELRGPGPPSEIVRSLCIDLQIRPGADRARSIAIADHDGLGRHSTRRRYRWHGCHGLSMSLTFLALRRRVRSRIEALGGHSGRLRRSRFRSIKSRCTCPGQEA